MQVSGLLLVPMDKVLEIPIACSRTCPIIGLAPQYPRPA
jgi:hypothetical protein